MLELVHPTLVQSIFAKRNQKLFFFYFTHQINKQWSFWVNLKQKKRRSLRWGPNMSATLLQFRPATFSYIDSGHKSSFRTIAKPNVMFKNCCIKSWRCCIHIRLFLTISYQGKYLVNKLHSPLDATKKHLSPKHYPDSIFSSSNVPLEWMFLSGIRRWIFISVCTILVLITDWMESKFSSFLLVLDNDSKSTKRKVVQIPNYKPLVQQ